MAVIVFLIAFLALKAPDAGLPIEYTVSLCVQLVLFVVWLVLAYCLGHALKKNEPLAMRPHLIWTLILTVTVIFHGVLMILRNVTELAEFYAALAILLTFMLVAEYRCYKWLEGKKFAFAAKIYCCSLAMRPCFIFLSAVCLLVVCSSSVSGLEGVGEMSSMRHLIYRIKQQIRKQRQLQASFDQLQKLSPAQDDALEG
uniref:Uncharacterized protein n=1 Tax=Plectus sambesii TaxID=2011161 RepID=A0A914X8C4_9BILA